MTPAMHLGEFDFDLPTELIAQEPTAERGGARLLCLHRHTGGITHAFVSALPQLLQPGDLVVVNNTRVFPARLIGRRVPSGGAVECVLIRRLDDDRWEALMHPGQKLRPGAAVCFDGARPIHGEVLERRFHGRRVIRLWTEDGSAVDEAVDAIGHIPLPPYIKRDDRPDDRERYQTSSRVGAAQSAAPTAGLHFTDALVDAFADRGIATVDITLHVGYGTFQPVRVEHVEDHRLDPERYEISDHAAAVVNGALGAGHRIHRRRNDDDANVGGGGGGGTTEARGRRRGDGSNFIYPGFGFSVISGLMTNFHLPRSSLLMLVAAFAGKDAALAAYRAAIAERYRFYSYGDAMLII